MREWISVNMSVMVFDFFVKGKVICSVSTSLKLIFLYLIPFASLSQEKTKVLLNAGRAVYDESQTTFPSSKMQIQLIENETLQST